jgi:GDPmannose 4,6-dehydratase
MPSTQNKTALITGITGQDGSYLVELLLEKGYNIHGLVRRTSQFNRARIDESREHAAHKGQVFDLHYGDLADASSIARIIAKVKPDELYNLAGQSHVGVSFEEPEYTALVDALGVLRLLESIKHISPNTRFYQASSSELFGNTGGKPANESTPFRPRSPYAAAKQYAFWTTVNYRESYGLHASNGILFNHESPRRGENFVTRKITLGFARIRAGLDQSLRLGNLESRRDWGFAKEYVELMWRILQQDHADDYVIATGESHSVREFVEQAALAAGFVIRWEGKGEHEMGRDAESGRILVQIDPRYYRPSEIDATVGDPAKARVKLGWSPKVKFRDLVALMVHADLEHLGVSRAS